MLLQFHDCTAIGFFLLGMTADGHRQLTYDLTLSSVENVANRLRGEASKARQHAKNKRDRLAAKHKRLLKEQARLSEIASASLVGVVLPGVRQPEHEAAGESVSLNWVGREQQSPGAPPQSPQQVVQQELRQSLREAEQEKRERDREEAKEEGEERERERRRVEQERELERTRVEEQERERERVEAELKEQRAVQEQRASIWAAKKRQREAERVHVRVEMGTEEEEQQHRHQYQQQQQQQPPGKKKKRRGKGKKTIIKEEAAALVHAALVEKEAAEQQKPRGEGKAKAALKPSEVEALRKRKGGYNQQTKSRLIATLTGIQSCSMFNTVAQTRQSKHRQWHVSAFTRDVDLDVLGLAADPPPPPPRHRLSRSFLSHKQVVITSLRARTSRGSRRASAWQRNGRRARPMKCTAAASRISSRVYPPPPVSIPSSSSLSYYHHVIIIILLLTCIVAMYCCHVIP